MAWRARAMAWRTIGPGSASRRAADKESANGSCQKFLIVSAARLHNPNAGGNGNAGSNGENTYECDIFE